MDAQAQTTVVVSLASHGERRLSAQRESNEPRAEQNLEGASWNRRRPRAQEPALASSQLVTTAADPPERRGRLRFVLLEIDFVGTAGSERFGKRLRTTARKTVVSLSYFRGSRAVVLAINMDHPSSACRGMLASEKKRTDSDARRHDEDGCDRQISTDRGRTEHGRVLGRLPIQLSYVRGARQ